METETKLNNTFIIEFYACPHYELELNRSEPNGTERNGTEPNLSMQVLTSIHLGSFSPWH